MRAKISALMDGELEGPQISAALAALAARDGEAYEAWCLYHAIGDTLCGTRPLSRRFGERFAQRLAAEPTVLAPAASRPRPQPRRRVVLSAAASVAAAAFVGWLALTPGDRPAPVRTAQAPVSTATAPVVVQAPARVPLPREADDYLLAHQSYSLRSSLQGMMPYVRTVAVENVAGKP